jgi:hypothetical protein
MEYSFLIKSVAGKIVPKSPDDLHRALMQEEGEEMMLSLKPVNKLSEKQRLYNFYHRAVLDAGIEVLTKDGWDGVDKVKADYYFKVNCAKGIMYNPSTNQEEIYILEKKAFPLERLYKFVVDCILLLELRHGYHVQDAQTWKQEQKRKYLK